MNLNTATSATDEEIKDVMDYQEWTPEQVENGTKIRDALGVALKLVIETVPPCPDRSAAIRKLREARMDCNSAITQILNTESLKSGGQGGKYQTEMLKPVPLTVL